MDNERIKILLVDDDEDDYLITRDLLSQSKDRIYDLEWVSTYEEALRSIINGEHDACLFDYRLGEYTGLDLLKEAVSAACKAPIIILTGQGERDIDIEALKAGATDYLDKTEITAQLLERSIRYAIERKRTEDRILRMAYYDTLTKLPNRSLFHDRLSKALAHAERYTGNCALLFLDLDNFKRINDTLEHRIGDLLIRGVADRLNHYVRSADTVARQGSGFITNTVARLGGDEFTILLTEISTIEDVAKVAQRILVILSQPFILDGHEVFASASIGIAIYPYDGEDMNTLIKNADTAMYHAKDFGKNNFQFYKNSMNATALERLTLENSLRKALERREFVLYYQPRVDIATGRIVGMEALIRWNHHQRGLIQPADFIPLAEETGLIIPIGEWVLKAVCKQNKIWQDSADIYTPVILSLNLSGLQFRQDTLMKVIEKVLDSTGLDPSFLELEITESVIMKNADTTVVMLNRLKDMGVLISMDDFGTGYSSFSYLKRFPLDNVKIDRSFIRDINENDEDAAIVKAIIVMAHTLNLRVVAEGVESEQQLELLEEFGCDEYQGYFFSRPLPEADVVHFIRKRSPQSSSTF
ncbi:MAG: EAL domain-containing protein [Nitrospiraceae bacterium]|nr:MAG: EAL domain-containing protein [Nitrospiraceae bacterium]